MRWLTVAVMALAGFAALAHWTLSNNQNPLGAGILAAAPLLIGILAGALLRVRPVANACYLLGICLLVAAPLFLEGAICILMYAPFAFPICMLAAFLASLIRRAILSPVALLLFLLPYLGDRPAPVESQVESAILVQQPVETVWATLDRLQMPFVADMPWVLRELLPVPVAIHGGGTHVGAERRLVFENGTVLARVSQSQAPESFTVALFIERSGREFFDHWVRLKDSRFRLERLPEGQTRIVHTTRYQPRMYPRWYWRPIETRLAGLVQGYLLEAYARQIFSPPIARK